MSAARQKENAFGVKWKKHCKATEDADKQLIRFASIFDNVSIVVWFTNTHVKSGVCLT